MALPAPTTAMVSIQGTRRVFRATLVSATLDSSTGKSDTRTLHVFVMGDTFDEVSSILKKYAMSLEMGGATVSVRSMVEETRVEDVVCTLGRPQDTCFQCTFVEQVPCARSNGGVPKLKDVHHSIIVRAPSLMDAIQAMGAKMASMENTTSSQRLRKLSIECILPDPSEESV